MLRRGEGRLRQAWNGREPAGARAASAGVIMTLACVAQLMVVLDVSVVNVALPSIQDQLGFTPANLQWVSNGYLLAFGGFLLLGGRLADVYGRARVFAAGLAGFALASLIGGLANDPLMLICARAGQGLGAAILAPTTLTLVTTTFAEGRQRTRALATWTAVSIAGGATGNLLGGVLTEYLTWRATLLINVPLGVLGFLAAVNTLGIRRGPARDARMDVQGAVLATTGLTALTYGITRIEEAGWGAAAAPLSTAAALLVSFAVVESRFARTPLMPPRLFRLRAIAVGNAVVLLAGACFQAPMWYLLTLSMQDTLSYSPLETGVGFLPHTLVTILVGWGVTPWLMRHVTGRSLVVTGTLLAAVGFVWQSRITADSSYLSGILLPAVVFSTGGGLLNTPLTAIVTSGADEAVAGAVSGLMNTGKQVGGALGLAALLSIANNGVNLDYRAAYLACAGILLLTSVASLALPAHRDTRP